MCRGISGKLLSTKRFYANAINPDHRAWGTHDLSRQIQLHSAPLREIIIQEFAPYGLPSIPFTCSDVDCPRARCLLALVIHELTTNALKYVLFRVRWANDIGVDGVSGQLTLEGLKPVAGTDGADARRVRNHASSVRRTAVPGCFDSVFEGPAFAARFAILSKYRARNVDSHHKSRDRGVRRRAFSKKRIVTLPPEFQLQGCGSPRSTHPLRQKMVGPSQQAKNKLASFTRT